MGPLNVRSEDKDEASFKPELINTGADITHNSMSNSTSCEKSRRKTIWQKMLSHEGSHDTTKENVLRRLLTHIENPCEKEKETHKASSTPQDLQLLYEEIKNKKHHSCHDILLILKEKQECSEESCIEWNLRKPNFMFFLKYVEHCKLIKIITFIRENIEEKILQRGNYEVKKRQAKEEDALKELKRESKKDFKICKDEMDGVIGRSDNEDVVEFSYIYDGDLGFEPILDCNELVDKLIELKRLTLPPIYYLVCGKGKDRRASQGKEKTLNEFLECMSAVRSLDPEKPLEKEVDDKLEQRGYLENKKFTDKFWIHCVNVASEYMKCMNNSSNSQKRKRDEEKKVLLTAGWEHEVCFILLLWRSDEFVAWLLLNLNEIGDKFYDLLYEMYKQFRKHLPKKLNSYEEQEQEQEFLHQVEDLVDEDIHKFFEIDHG